MFSILLPTFNPIAIHIGNFGIRWYALAYIAGLLLGTMYISWLYKKSEVFDNFKISRKKLLEDIFFTVALSIIIGGRLGYVLFYNFSIYAQDPLEILRVWHGGMSFHGALIGGALGLFILSKIKKISVLSLYDIILTAAPIGLCFGRLANFVNQELQGRPTTVPWAVIYNGQHIPQHPSEIYEALLEGVVLFFLMLFFWKRFKMYKKPGYCACLFLICYGAFRIFAECFRQPDYQLGYFFGFLTMGQILSFVMILIGAMVLGFLKNKYRKV